MRITNYTTYSLRTLMFAALHNDRLCKVQEVADAFGDKIASCEMRSSIGTMGGFCNALGQWWISPRHASRRDCYRGRGSQDRGYALSCRML